jgi:AraC-like DNA-binding protein
VKRAGSLESFVADPVGSWFAPGECVTWVASPTLGGATVWGNPNVESTRLVIRAFDALWAKGMAAQVDVVLDGRRIERVDPAALGMLVEWAGERRAEVVRKVRQQIGVVAPGLVGLTLSGILPVIGDTHPFRVVHDPLEAHRALSGGDDAIGREVQALVEECSGVVPELRALRELLRARNASITLQECARALGSSTRSLQRSLGSLGTSFQHELRDARFAVAREMLATTEEKIATIANRVGVTEGALTQLVRERTGKTPAELRRSRG